MHKIRTKGKLTQKLIRQQVGINPETIRNIEYGLQLPTISTLSKLSEVYNVDTLQILESCRLEKGTFIQTIKNKIDDYSYSDNLDEIDTLINQMDDFLETTTDIYPEHFINKVKQLNLLIYLIKQKNKTDILNIQQSIKTSLDALSITHKNLNINKISNLYFDLIELRILMILSFNYLRDYKNDLALNVMDTVIYNLENHSKSNPEAFPLLINSYFLKSYELFVLNRNEEVIDQCKKGIKLSREKYFMKYLPSLYYRKGISEYLLKKNNYKNTLQLCFHTLDTLEDKKTKKIYTTVLNDKYNISIE